MDDSRAAGQRLARALPLDGLRAVLLLIGRACKSTVVQYWKVWWMSGAQHSHYRRSGGGRGAFAQTWILDGEGASSERLTCVGLYGEQQSICPRLGLVAGRPSARRARSHAVRTMCSLNSMGSRPGGLQALSG